MNRKTTLLAGMAGALLLSAPALAAPALVFAQETDPAQTAPATAAESPALSLQPGATVKGSDGATLGQLVGVRAGAAGQQELTVRGADGQLRAVPLAGLRQDGGEVIVGWSGSEFQAAPAIPDEGTPDAN